MSEAGRAADAADDAVKAATLSKKFRNEAAADRQRVEQLTPDPHRDMIQTLANEEGRALLRIGPKRSRWRDLAAFEDRLVTIELRRTALRAELASRHERLQLAPKDHAARLAAWMEGGEKGDRPSSEASEHEHRIADAQAEHDALGVEHDRNLRERAEHVERNRPRFLKDVRAALEKAAKKQIQLVDELEANRQEILELRRTEVWAAVFPDPSIMSEPNAYALAGAVKRIQQPLLPGLAGALPAVGVFALLRRDVEYCAKVATADQLAVERGISVAELTGREASWQNGEADLVGPAFPATWAGSDDAKAQAEREQEYARQTSRRLWGEEPSWGE